MNNIFILIVNLTSFIWRTIPSPLRRFLIKSILVIDTRGSNPVNGLKQSFFYRDVIDWIINERAIVYGNGIHPKHDLTKYHQFFINEIRDGDSVLDVGCGYGAVARSIANTFPSSHVVGIDSSSERLTQAINSEKFSNLSYIQADVLHYKFQNKFDVVVLSNVLEHIDDRVAFLKQLIKSTRASRMLIRVPLFERDWQMPMRKKIGVNYFSDDDHKIEHTISEFDHEVDDAGLKISKKYLIWGEIWAICTTQ
ncbi:class I SAM-dependent methyltransferase [Polynucleobacter victoriensis]|uniref:Methyltransferase domain-containing protein n=1 Tax=Polynucleobacter victoriensis TaxID=2049319 RepID=A0A212T8K7_9BURK|nr:class I SAM-dependent methyltransferase [Polynucleobacter victoriensis]SNC62146.1 Methyltransferase domain-containing protein [Polynucleobacter victoriensis]